MGTQQLTGLNRNLPLAALTAFLLFTQRAIVHSQGFTFVTNNGTITITGYIDSGSSVTIPDTINGLPVTTIAAYAFPEDGSLTNVMIGNGITNIGDCAFCDCTSLSAINVSASNSCYSSVNGILFDRGMTTLIQYPASKTGSCYAVPNGVIDIGDAAFYHTFALTNVTIPRGAKSIGLEAFYDCINLTNLAIPDTITTVGSWAFWSCGFVNITIPYSVKTLEVLLFFTA